MRTYLVTGATGNTGKVVAEGLLAAGQKVRVLSRSAEKAKFLTDKGAELFIGDGANAADLSKAMAGVDAAYLMIPPNWTAPDFFAYQMTWVNAMTEAAKNSGLKYAVTLSSIGAHLESDAGVVQGLERMEKALDSVEGLNTLHLRAGYFFENTLGQTGAVKAMGAMASPVDPELKVPMVATRDIGEMALKRLLALDFPGKNHVYVLGSRDVNYTEVASVIGNAIGKPDLKYFPVSFDDFSAVMRQFGAGDSMISRMNEFIRSLNEGKVLAHAKRNGENTTPTSIEEFAHVFKYVYDMN